MIIAAALVSTSAIAAEMEIVKKHDVSISAAASMIEIQGVRPGMPADEAWAIFSKAYPSDAPDTQKVSIQVRTSEVESQSFDISYDNDPGINKDSLQILLASPSVGGGVFAVHRDIYYPAEQGRPQISAVMEQLEQKYGKPSRVEKSRWDKGVHLFWYVGGSGKCKEDAGICGAVHKPTSINGYDPASFSDYVREMGYGPEVIVAARVAETPDGDAKAFSLDLSFLDIRRRGMSAESDTDQVMAAQKALTEKPAALPAL